MLDVFTLFLGRAGGIVVSLVFLPWYFRLLTPTDFGLVSVLVSIQSLALVLDLGLSVVIGRDVAASLGAAGVSDDAIASWTRSRCVIGAAYAVVAVGAVLVSGPMGGAGTLTALSGVVLVALVVQSNLATTVLVSLGRYRLASVLQIGGGILKAIVTVACLKVFGGSILVFVLAQAGIAFLHWRLADHLASRATASSSDRSGCDVRGLVALVRRAAPVSAFTAAGAVTMQIDKPLISILMSPTDVGPYFLACTFVLVPIAVLAGPVAQYFQPKLVAALRSSSELARLARSFGNLLVVSLAAPVVALWWYRDSWLALWLGAGGDIGDVSAYVHVLLPATTVGALGYIPSALLIAAGRFAFLARMAVVQLCVVVALVVVGAVHQSIAAIVWVYAMYHVTSTAVMWFFAWKLEIIGQPLQAAFRAVFSNGLPLLAILMVVAMVLPALGLGSLAQWVFCAIGAAISAPLLLKSGSLAVSGKR